MVTRYPSTRTRNVGAAWREVSVAFQILLRIAMRFMDVVSLVVLPVHVAGNSIERRLFLGVANVKSISRSGVRNVLTLPLWRANCAGSAMPEELLVTCKRITFIMFAPMVNVGVASQVSSVNTAIEQRPKKVIGDVAGLLFPSYVLRCVQSFIGYTLVQAM